MYVLVLEPGWGGVGKAQAHLGRLNGLQRGQQQTTRLMSKPCQTGLKLMKIFPDLNSAF